MKKPVWIIDDDDDVREVMSYALENEGYDVQSYANPLVAMDVLASLASEKLPGFILIDYRMPEMNGLAFVEALMMNYEHTLGQIPMAICSAEDDLANTQNFPKNIHHLQKPMELENLVKTVRHFCN